MASCISMSKSVSVVMSVSPSFRMNTDTIGCADCVANRPHFGSWTNV